MLFLLSVIAGMGAIVICIELLRRYLPGLYFPMSELIHGINPNIGSLGLALRFVIPLAVGVGVGVILVDDYAIGGGGAAFLGAVFLVWPQFLRPESIDFRYKDRQAELRIVYLMFVGSYTFLGLAGGQLGGYTRELVSPVVDNASASDLLDAARDEFGLFARGLVSGVAGSALFAALTYLVRRRSSKWEA